MINDPRRTDYVSIVRLYTIIEKAGFTVWVGQSIPKKG